MDLLHFPKVCPLIFPRFARKYCSAPLSSSLLHLSGHLLPLGIQNIDIMYIISTRTEAGFLLFYGCFCKLWDGVNLVGGSSGKDLDKKNLVS
jgi:hypothetical protein